MKSNHPIKLAIVLFFMLCYGDLITLNAQTAQKTSANVQQQMAALKQRFGTPSWADTVKNPYIHNAPSIDSGRMIYQHICAVCHGTSGKGDGVAAGGLNVMPADHTSAPVQLQTDGSLFYAISNGHPPMPSYKNVLSLKQRWSLVNYIRTLDKSKPKT